MTTIIIVIRRIHCDTVTRLLPQLLPFLFLKRKAAHLERRDLEEEDDGDGDSDCDYDDGVDCDD